MDKQQTNPEPESTKCADPSAPPPYDNLFNRSPFAQHGNHGTFGRPGPFGQPSQTHLLEGPNCQPRLYPNLNPNGTCNFKELQDFILWNNQQKLAYLQSLNLTQQEIQEIMVNSMDPAVAIANGTVGNKIVWSQPQTIGDAAALPQTVHNHYYAPIINTNSHREFINCCEDCCEDVCENVCLDCSRLTDYSKITIGSLLGSKTDQDGLANAKYDPLKQCDTLLQK